MFGLGVERGKGSLFLWLFITRFPLLVFCIRFPLPCSGSLVAFLVVSVLCQGYIPALLDSEKEGEAEYFVGGLLGVVC
jgi:hypothetical protein